MFVGNTGLNADVFDRWSWCLALHTAVVPAAQ